MKKIRNVIAIALIFITVLQFNITAFAATKTKSPYTDKTYTHQTRFDSYQKLNCIDVSHHNGDINFKKVKADGVDAVFVRVGYTGYTRSKHSLNYDKNYKTYIENAIAAGLKVGAYWYSQAVTVSEAKTEAQKLVSAISDYEITMPVVMDYEFADVSDGRLDYAWSKKTINASKMTANANAFLAAVDDAGYQPCIYASKYFFYDNLNVEDLYDNCVTWLAHYTTNTDYKYDFKYWQYTDSGKVDGISNYTDCNFVYLAKDESLDGYFYVDDISNKAYTGKEIKPEPVVKVQGEELVYGTDYTLAYKNNVSVGKATITIKGINDYQDIPERTAHFNIVPGKVSKAKVSKTATTSATISWDGASKATDYVVQVYRKNGWVDAGTTQSKSFTVKNLNSASNYKFRVAGYKVINGVKYKGSYSDTVYGTTLPKKLSVSYTSNASSITLKWSKEKYSNGYKIYKYDSKTKKYNHMKTISSPNTVSYKISKLKANTQYIYKVRAYKISKDKKTVYGSWSNTCKAYTKPSAPTLSSAKCTGSRKLKATWKKVSGVSGYQIRWSTSSKFSKDYLDTTASSKSASKTIKTSKSKRKYYVKVRAYKTRDGKKYYSAWSNSKGVYIK